MAGERRDLGDLAAELARELVAERFPEDPAHPMTLEQMEDALAEVKRELGERLQRAWIEQSEPAEPNQSACACGRAARFCGSRQRAVVTQHGELRFCRRYYHCRHCHTGFAPRDQQLGLDGHTASPRVRAWFAELGSDGIFAAAVRRLETFTAVRLSESTATRVAVEVGRRLRQEELAEAERILQGDAVPRRSDWRPTRLYVSLDGTMTPLRDPWKRNGSQGKLNCRYGECKTAVCYETRLDGRGRPIVARRRYTATLEPVEVFEKLLAGLAYHCGSDRAKELVVLADGLAYNWRIAAEFFPEALQILDFYHALDHLYRLARLCLDGGQKQAGEGSPLPSAAWVALQKEKLLQDGAGAVREAILALPAPTPDAVECQAETHGYFTNNAERMRYGTFLAAGYQIGSGVMEAACKTVAHQRLDQSGMHWRPETADAIVALRANQLSDQPRPLRPYCVNWT
jgi:hypothetical protein